MLSERAKAGQGPFPVQQIVDWADQLLDVLYYLHEEFDPPIIHRDIKPQNLKRTPKNEIILLDFGLAKGSHPGMTLFQGSIPGATLAYAALEQIGGEGTDARSDVYSLGITLYQLMTGVKPPNAANRAAKERHDPMRPAYQVNNNIPEEISEVLERATALRADDRFESVNQMRAALRSAASPRSGHRTYESHTTASTDEPRPPAVHASPQPFLEDLGNNVTLEMIRIEGGSFSMGTLDAISLDGEHPRHFVTVSPFHTSKYPITQAQWRALMRNNPSTFKGETFPVENVSWHDALRFCEALSAHSGKTYRLLTEAEWEFACRAGTVGDYSFGNDESQLKEYAWFVENSDQQTHAVGQKRPNAMGLHDMHGNVWEWCGDWHDDRYYAVSPDFDPKGPASGTARVLRGGSWSDDSYSCRSARRNSGDPFNRSLNVGFRVAV
jgi:formylglycine-generating enzyme required for sulfatase activity